MFHMFKLFNVYVCLKTLVNYNQIDIGMHIFQHIICLEIKVIQTKALRAIRNSAHLNEEESFQ